MIDLMILISEQLINKGYKMTKYDMVEKEEHSKLTEQLLPGPTYLDWLQWAHKRFAPERYVEIGVETGQSLQYVNANCKAVGIDPKPQITYGFNAWAKIYAQESDEFFVHNDLTKVLGGKVDLAFIDGLHTFDQTLRDILNVERHSHKDTVIILHDVAPVIAATATRERNTYWWAGDTWKVMPILNAYRPDLKIVTVPAFPTGIAIITNLNTKVNEEWIDRNYDRVIANAFEYKFEDYIPVNLVANNYAAALNKLL